MHGARILLVPIPPHVQSTLELEVSALRKQICEVESELTTARDELETVTTNAQIEADSKYRQEMAALEYKIEQVQRDVAAKDRDNSKLTAQVSNLTRENERR